MVISVQRRSSNEGLSWSRKRREEANYTVISWETTLPSAKRVNSWDFTRKNTANPYILYLISHFAYIFFSYWLHISNKYIPQLFAVISVCSFLIMLSILPLLFYPISLTPQSTLYISSPLIRSFTFTSVGARARAHTTNIPHSSPLHYQFLSPLAPLR